MLELEFRIEHIYTGESLDSLASLVKTVFTSTIFIARAIVIPDWNSQ